MRKQKKRSGKEQAKTELFSDEDFDVEEFVDAMDDDDSYREPLRASNKGSRRRIDDLLEARMLRIQLSDWDD